MRIYRGIALNEGEKINVENIGCSWSLDDEYADKHADGVKESLGKDGFVILFAEVDETEIDWLNTLFAQDTRPHEYEIVLKNVPVEGYIFLSRVSHIDTLSDFSGVAGDNTFEDYLSNSYESIDLAAQTSFLAMAETFGK